MQLGMIGLGRMGANMVRRLLGAGHPCVVYDLRPAAATDLVRAGALAAPSLADLVRQLARPRALWLMLPAGGVDATLAQLHPLLEPGDTVIDGGNSAPHDDQRRAAELRTIGVAYVDVGVSGGVAGLQRGYCLMIGGESAIVQRLDPLFAALAPGIDAAPRTPGRVGSGEPAERGYLHCGPSGAGHFVKMVHNGIEYGLMAAYAEGLNILKHADSGLRPPADDAETAPLRHPERYQYTIDLPAVAEV